MFETDSQSYYEILDVKPDASQSDIRQAYLRTKAAYSKDSAALYSIFDEHETRHVLESIEQAYLVLSNPEKRKEYDRVHGFLRNSERLPETRKTASGNHVFSFSKNAESGDAAHQAARAVFGAGADSDVNQHSHEFQDRPTPIAASVTSFDSHDDYTTPRTLAAQDTMGSSAREHHSDGFSSQGNRLGIIRRIDLLKGHEKDPQMETLIEQETEFRGEFLRKVREYRGISIEEMADFTKISRTYINCVESEEFESLPAAAYLRGFVVQIAKALKLPHDKAAAAYMDHYKKTVLK